MWLKLSYIVDESFDVLHVTDKNYTRPKTYVDEDKEDGVGYGGDAWGRGHYTTKKNKNMRVHDNQKEIDHIVYIVNSLKERIDSREKQIKEWEKDVVKILTTNHPIGLITTAISNLDESIRYFTYPHIEKFYNICMRLKEKQQMMTNHIFNSTGPFSETKALQVKYESTGNSEYKILLDVKLNKLITGIRGIATNIERYEKIVTELVTLNQQIANVTKRQVFDKQNLSEYESKFPSLNNYRNTTTDVTHGYQEERAHSIVRNQRIPVGANILDLQKVPLEIAIKLIKADPTRIKEIEKQFDIDIANPESIPANFVDIYAELLGSNKLSSSSKINYSALIKSLGYDAIEYPAFTHVKNNLKNLEKPTTNILIVNDEILSPKKFERKNLKK